MCSKTPLGFLGGLLLLTFVPQAAQAQTPHKTITGAPIACQDGKAASYSCSSIDLLSFLPRSEIGGPGRLNDIWGWTDPETGREYALVGRADGTAFVDISDPVNPIYLGILPTHTEGAPIWRDVKVYQNHAYVVADAAGQHGMQVFDLTRLRGVANPPVTFDETAHYDQFASAHNVVINAETGFAYVVGGGGGGQTCGGGLHMVDLREPTNPTFAGCFADPGTGRRGTGYTHDAQCVVYRGPDVEYQGQEICFGANETALSIADVTDKENPKALSATTYPSVSYTHQGWLTEDHRYFYVDDELDEISNGIPQTRTLIWDVSDLDDPQLANEYRAATSSIDHNLYVVGNFVYQSNYTSGLRILNIEDPERPEEVGFFDTFPQLCPGPRGGQQCFQGSWSNYPFFESGVVAVSSINEGLFLLKPTEALLRTGVEERDGVPTTFVLQPAYPNPFNPQTTLTLDLDATQPVTVAAYDVLGRQVALVHKGILSTGTHALTFDAADLPGGVYLIRASGEGTVATQTVTLLK